VYQVARSRRIRDRLALKMATRMNRAQFGKAEQKKGRGLGHLRCSKRNAATLACGLATAASLSVIDGVQPRLRGTVASRKLEHVNKDSSQQASQQRVSHPMKNSFVSRSNDEDALSEENAVAPCTAAYAELQASDARCHDADAMSFMNASLPKATSNELCSSSVQWFKDMVANGVVPKKVGKAKAAFAKKMGEIIDGKARTALATLCVLKVKAKAGLIFADANAKPSPDDPKAVARLKQARDKLAEGEHPAAKALCDQSKYLVTTVFDELTEAKKLTNAGAAPDKFDSHGATVLAQGKGAHDKCVTDMDELVTDDAWKKKKFATPDSSAICVDTILTAEFLTISESKTAAERLKPELTAKIDQENATLMAALVTTCKEAIRNVKEAAKSKAKEKEDELCKNAANDDKSLVSKFRKFLKTTDDGAMLEGTDSKREGKFKEDIEAAVAADDSGGADTLEAACNKKVSDKVEAESTNEKKEAMKKKLEKICETVLADGGAVKKVTDATAQKDTMVTEVDKAIAEATKAPADGKNQTITEATTASSCCSGR